MKNTLKKLIAQGDIEESMRILLDYLTDEHSPLLSIAIALSSRYALNKQKIVQGEEGTVVEADSIVTALLELLDSMDDF